MTDHDIELAKQAGFFEKTKGSVSYEYGFASIPLTRQLTKFAELIRAEKQTKINRLESIIKDQRLLFDAREARLEKFIREFKENT
jgi:hypothetical protein